MLNIGYAKKETNPETKGFSYVYKYRYGISMVFFAFTTALSNLMKKKEKNSSIYSMCGIFTTTKK
jgi:hypothetical protein